MKMKHANIQTPFCIDSGLYSIDGSGDTVHGPPVDGTDKYVTMHHIDKQEVAQFEICRLF